MTGYCPDCGNTLCICPAVTYDRESLYLLGRGWLHDPPGRTPGWYWIDSDRREWWFKNITDAYARQKIFDQAIGADMVHHPLHYNMGKYETIDIIEDADLGYHLSAALKYILRCKYKGKTDEDLAKAVWYIERYRKLIHGTDTVPDVSTIQRSD